MLEAEKTGRRLKALSNSRSSEPLCCQAALADQTVARNASMPASPNLPDDNSDVPDTPVPRAATDINHSVTIASNFCHIAVCNLDIGSARNNIQNVLGVGFRLVESLCA
jgi:hypothetical protein